jgi:hypothetical protein
MITLTKSATQPGQLPPLHASSGLAAGHVYVLDQQEQRLAADQRAVLQTQQGGRLEVSTSDTIGVQITAPGTYLNATDYATLADQDTPTLRLYGYQDTLAKLRAAPGFLTALTALLSVLTALLSVFFVWSAMTAPGPTAINDRAQALLESVQSGGNTQAQAAVSCLKEIRGSSTQQVSVPGVDCSPVQTPWWRQPTWGSLITGLLGVASAAAGTITVASKFGFQKSPGG